jgi:NADH-ubiquinone oxidoreductase chain 5
MSVELLVGQFSLFELPISFFFDSVFVGFGGCVILVTVSVLIFSIVYMGGTTRYRRFVYLLLMFVFSILLLVSADRFITVLVGWDGLGLTSFCLVIFYERPRRLSSGLLTVLTNRLGDSMFICSLFYFFLVGGLSVVDHYHYSYLMAILLVVGSITKRAQLPFCS